MKRRPTPWTGLVMVGALAFSLAPRANAQLGMFGMGGNADGGADGGLLEVKKYLENPWRQDAGGADSGPGWLDQLKKLGGGSGAGFLKERAPTIAEMADSDASFLPAGGDGGSSWSSFTLPSFGADIDAGVKNAGPVVPPQLRVARATDEVTPLTTLRAPAGTTWGRLPEPAQARFSSLLASIARLSHDALTRAQRRALWDVLHDQRGWGEGAPAFLLSDVGGPVPARLVVLGVRVSPSGRAFYGGFVPPRDGTQPVGARVVLAASDNVGKTITQPPRPTLRATLRTGLDQVSTRMGAPFGRAAPPRVGALHVVVVRSKLGWRVEVQAREKATPRAAPPLCMEVTADADGRLLSHKDWSPECDHLPVAAVDVDGDGVDEVLWREGARLVLRRYPDGTALAEDST